MDNDSSAWQLPLHCMPADSCTMAQLAILGALQQSSRDLAPAAGGCGCRDSNSELVSGDESKSGWPATRLIRAPACQEPSTFCRRWPHHPCRLWTVQADPHGKRPPWHESRGHISNDRAQGLPRQLSRVMCPLLQILGLAVGERGHSIPHVRRELRGQASKTGPYQAALRAAERAAKAAPAGSDEVGAAALAKPVATEASAKPLQAAAPPAPKPIVVCHLWHSHV